MRLSTTAEVIGLAKRLEEESADLYRELSTRHADQGAVFLSLSSENKKYLTQIERVYYGVITDALEGCFSFDLDPEPYRIEKNIFDNLTLVEALNAAISLEQNMINFYTKAANQSEALMADIPRAFKMVAKKRGERIIRLKSQGG